MYSRPLNSTSVLFAGRTLQAATADYVLYSQERAAAQELQQWLHRELVVFRARYGGEFNRPGLIFAIEPGDDPAPEIGEWHKIAVSYKGRPYTFFGSYFQESFYVSPSEAQRTSLINAASTRPAWICFLTTDTHTKQAFDAKVRRHRHDALEEWRIQWKDRSPDQKIVGAGFILPAGYELLSVVGPAVEDFYERTDDNLRFLHVKFHKPLQSEKKY